LKFARDRHRWLHWVFEAKKRYGLRVLNYMVTSNHIHLLVRNIGERDAMPNSIQLMAIRTGQENNENNNFWDNNL
jgi:putative transposase